jgi:hypothetical protein
MYPPIFARKRSSKNVTAATDAQVTIEELLDVSFYMRLVTYQRKVGDWFFPEQLLYI